jgi:preprotein translocase subunit SecD
MLYFTRWKATAIILTAFVVCLFAVPNFLPEKMVQSWPKWAQRHIVLGLDLQGGSHILLEVDTNAVRKEKLEAVRDDVRRVLRDARVGYTGLVVRANRRSISYASYPNRSVEFSAAVPVNAPSTSRRRREA